MKKTILYISTIVLAAAWSCSTPDAPESAESVVDESLAEQYDLALQDKYRFFGRIEARAENPENPYSPEKVKLGHKLYFDTRLSKDENISCNSCHNLATFGVDNLPTSPGDAGETGDRNSPTVLNAALHQTQFWDGRAKDVEEQAGMPVLNPVEMAIPNELFLVGRLKDIKEYRELFGEAFPNDRDPVNYENIRKAIASFERELMTPSRLDQFLSGNKDALNMQEKKGMLAFSAYNCVQCHNGPLLGGNSFQKFGVYQDYWELTGSEHIDKGRFANTGDSTHMYMFKVPSLRNVAKTAPYFHDGSVKSLAEAVRIMGKAQLDIELQDEEVENIVAFLKTLTGEVPSAYTTAPR